MNLECKTQGRILVETISTQVMVMVYLSCLLVITERFAAMELGQSISITGGKYVGKAA